MKAAIIFKQPFVIFSSIS